MIKKILLGIGVFVLVSGLGIGVAYAADPEALQGAAARLTQVFVTNWPSNQNVTVTNTSLPVSVSPPENQNVTITNPSPIPVSMSSSTVGQKWEYLRVSNSTTLISDAQLNLYGQDGWELWQYEHGYVSGSGNWDFAIFRKAIQ